LESFRKGISEYINSHPESFLVAANAIYPALFVGAGGVERREGPGKGPGAGVVAGAVARAERFLVRYVRAKKRSGFW
jgi:hypothetical protein